MTNISWKFTLCQALWTNFYYFIQPQILLSSHSQKIEAHREKVLRLFMQVKVELRLDPNGAWLLEL